MIRYFNDFYIAMLYKCLSDVRCLVRFVLKLDISPLTIENYVQHLATATAIIPLADEPPDEHDTYMKFTWLSEEANEYLAQISKDSVNTLRSKL